MYRHNMLKVKLKSIKGTEVLALSALSSQAVTIMSLMYTY